jgi:hypothetical protein
MMEARGWRAEAKTDGSRMIAEVYRVKRKARDKEIRPEKGELET